jgi:MFS family permease
MSFRIGRNYRYAGSGNAITAATMGALGAYVSVRAIFAAAAALCVPALIALSYIRPREIDYLRARNATKNDAGFTVKRLADLARNRHLLVFAGCIGLFQLANSSLLPLVSETLAHRNISSSSLFMGAMLVVSQVVVASLAPWVGYWSELWGRKPLLLIGFAVEMVRTLLLAFIVNPWFITAIEVLDGVTGAIVIVLTIVIVMDLTTATGRFNLAQGVLGAFSATAASVGTAAVGFIAGRFGDVPAFLSTTASIACGIALITACLPETKPESYVD